MGTIRLRMPMSCVLLYLAINFSLLPIAMASEVSDEEEKILQKIDELLLSYEQKTVPASISVDFGWDSESGKNYFSSLDLPVFEQRLLLSGGQNTSLNTITDEQETSTSYSVGIFSDARDKLGLGVEYRSWKFEESVEINALRGTIEVNYPAVIFSFTPMFRNIAFKDTVRTLSGPREVEAHIDSSGYNANLTFYMPENVWLSGAYASHIYNDEIFFLSQSRSFFDLIQTQTSLMHLSPAVLNNTYGLEKNRKSVNLGLDFESTGISVGWSESVSAVDAEKTMTTDGTIYWNLDKHWRLGLNGGVQTNSINSDQISFGNLSLKYRF